MTTVASCPDCGAHLQDLGRCFIWGCTCADRKAKFDRLKNSGAIDTRYNYMQMMQEQSLTGWNDPPASQAEEVAEARLWAAESGQGTSRHNVAESVESSKPEGREP